MRVEFLGTKGNVEESAPYHSRFSGVMIDDLLFDLGEREYLRRNPRAVFITHLHPDHAFFITESSEIEVPIYAPEAERHVTRILDEPISMNSHRVTPVPTHHSKKVRSAAYVIEQEGRRVLYTGDLIWIDKKYHDLLRSLDLVITDGSFMKKGGLIRKDEETGRLYGHNGVPDLIGLFQDFTDRIAFTHFGGWFFKDIPSARKKLESVKGVDIIVSYDGMVLEL